MKFMSSCSLVGVALVLAPGIAGCGSPNVDVGKVVTVSNLTTGWFDAGIVNGQNKLVPSASFTVTNVGRDTLSGLQVFAVFKLIGETQELGSALVVLRGQDALKPSAMSKPITVRATWGFSGEQPRGQMMMHTQFRDARIEIFAKYGATQFVKLTEATVSRQLLTQ